MNCQRNSFAPKISATLRIIGLIQKERSCHPNVSKKSKPCPNITPW
jgi:hypothetical protein